jgi:cellulose synthase/poly-beta-1,6-N-acetylglucosamine synthase-like glycosyltransferase
MSALIVFGWLGALAVLAALGLHEVWWLRRARGAPAQPTGASAWRPDADAPVVTVQLTICNERELVAGAVQALFALHYPRERLQLQLCDDSSDPLTIAECERWCVEGRRQGRWIDHLRRADRRGFTAGNLNHARRFAAGEFAVIVDVDFRLAPDLLTRTLPLFAAQPRLAAAQTSWAHINRGENVLTQVADSIFDLHLFVEQPTRSALGAWAWFTGSAGIWRRSVIDGLGGWAEDVGTQDLDLSIRAQLAGWRIVFCGDVVSAARLPNERGAVLSQQSRWAHGCGLLLRRFAHVAWPGPSWRRRLSGLMHLAAYFAPLAICAVQLLALPCAVVLTGNALRRPVELLTLALWATTFAAGATVVRAARLRKGARGAGGPSWASTGISVTTALAFVRGLLGAPMRPWQPSNSRSTASDTGALVATGLLTAWAIAGAGWALLHGAWALAVPVLCLTPGNLVLLLNPTPSTASPEVHHAH